jgi:O-succinylbenzoic acid--CoA ligase
VAHVSEALACARGALSYAALASRAESLAAALRAAGVSAGAPVAVLASGAPECALLFHAAARAGAVLLPLHARLTVPELRAQLAESGARTLVFDDALAETAAALADALGLAGLRITLGDGLEPALALAAGRARPPAPAELPARLDPERAQLRLFTSGTSGAPKAAELSARALHASALGHARLIGLAPDERWLACLPLYHVGGLSILVRCALAGAAAELHERFDEERVCAALASGRIALVSLVPAMLARVLDAWGERPAPAALRCALVGGAAADPALLARGRALGFPLAPSYGLTEAASQVATRLPSDAREPLGARLRPLPGTALRLAEDGEILVRGPTLMTRYVGRPAETARALAGGWLHTGDAGRLDAEGGLEVLDRRADLIVSGGENVYPAEIEAVLHEHPAVLEAGVVARPDARFGARPVAWIVARPGRAPDEAGLRAHCLARLASFKTPDAFRITDALPRNASGKLLRRELREREQRAHGGEAPS